LSRKAVLESRTRCLARYLSDALGLEGPCRAVAYGPGIRFTPWRLRHLAEPKVALRERDFDLLAGQGLVDLHIELMGDEAPL